MPMQWRQNGPTGEWFKVVDLPPATHQYKFIIDGQWRHDHTAPTVLDNLGNVNNCIQVQPSAVGAAGANAGDRAAVGSASPEPSRGVGRKVHSSHSVSRTTSDPYNLGGGGLQQDSYSQDIPARDELLVHHSASLLLPPQLRLLLPHHHGDATTMPLCVQMNHVFCHLPGDFSIFAMAHRYRDRSVTQLLYKPTGSPRRPKDLPSLVADGSASLDAPPSPVGTDLRAQSKDVVLQSVRISGTQRQRENNNEYVAYIVDSVLLVHGVQTTLRSERRYKHFNLLDQLLRREFGPLVPQALPAKRAFGNLHPTFVEERRVALERYLQQCVAIPALAASSLFCQFVEANLTKAGAADFGADDVELHHSLHRVCTKQGHLLKRGRRVTSWKRRYFCLCDGEVFYYYTAEMCNPFQPLGVISMTAPPNGKSDGADAADSGAAADGGASSHGAVPMHAKLSTVIIEPHSHGEYTLPHHFSFAVHTPMRTWHLAADSAKERDDWVRVLCACGAQLSASSAAAPPAAAFPLPSPPAAALPSSAAEASSGEGAPSTTEVMSGLLHKRASKVHVAQRSEAETGQARDWVARHFCLRDHGVVVYYQNADDPVQHARGLVPLAGFDRVEHAEPPQEDLPYAFRLMPRDGAGEAGAVVLATTSEEERNSWINHLSRALGEARAAREPTPVEALATSLATTKLEVK